MTCCRFGAPPGALRLTPDSRRIKMMAFYFSPRTVGNSGQAVDSPVPPQSQVHSRVMESIYGAEMHLRFQGHCWCPCPRFPVAGSGTHVGCLVCSISV